MTQYPNYFSSSQPTSIVCLLAHSLTTRLAVARIAPRSHLYVIYLAVSSYLIVLSPFTDRQIQESCPNLYTPTRLAFPCTTHRLLTSINLRYPMNQPTAENKAAVATLPPMFSPGLAVRLNYGR